MALLDRLKERFETDLSDAELQAILDAITAEIEERFGAEGEITVVLDSDRDLKPHKRYHKLDRPIDTGETVTVVETTPGNSGTVADQTTLSANDFRVVHGGQTIERLITGDNPSQHWAELVTVTYTPVSQQKQRDEVTIQVAQIQIQSRGLNSERAGDYQATHLDLTAESEKLLMTLQRNHGLVMA